MKAVILAAGQGTRLHPVTLTMPKPLVPVANKSLIIYAIEVLQSAGLTDIGIVVNDSRSPIVQALGDGEQIGVRIDYIVQKELNGLAHAISLCQSFTGDAPFCVFLGDNIFQDRMVRLIREFPETRVESVVVLAEVADPTRFGIAEIDQDRIIRVVEKPQDPPSNLAICGVYLFRPSIYDAIGKIQPSWRNELEITDAIQQLICEGKVVQQYTLQGWWVDAGKPDAIIEANQYVLGDMDFTLVSKNGQVDNSSEVSYRVDLGKGSEVIASKIRGPVVIGSNVTIKNSYVGPYTAIGDNVVVENSEIEASIVMNNCTLRDLPGRIDSSLMADNSTVTSSESRNPAVHRFVLAENSYVQV